MIDNIKSIVLAIAAVLILGGVYYVVDEYTDALAYVKKYEDAQKRIVSLEAEIKRLEGLVEADSQLGADFTTERDGLHDYFGGLEDELWKDYRCGLMPALEMKTELAVVTTPTKVPVKSVPVKQSDNNALTVAWKAYCSTIDKPVEGCEVVK